MRDTDGMSVEEPTLLERANALVEVLTYRPSFLALILLLTLATAVLEGIGLSFILPIINYASGGPATTGNESRLIQFFVSVYTVIGIPFTIEYLVVGVGVVMGVRHGASFAVEWLEAKLGAVYVRDLRMRTFERILDARIGFLDEKGSKTLINAVITQTQYPANVLGGLVAIVKQALIALAYLSVALYIAPLLTVLAGALIGGITFLIRFVVEPAYTAGDRVAATNERVQDVTQSGILGVRTIKLFELYDSIMSSFETEVDRSVSSQVRLRRNEALMNHSHRFASALVVFVLVYFTLTSAGFTLSSAGVFLFAMFRLAPTISGLNHSVYYLIGQLPHLVQTLRLIQSLDEQPEPVGADATLDGASRIEFEAITFSYGEEPAVQDVSFAARRGEFIAFVGPSGSGKSTVISLLARLYEPDSGSIRIDDHPIDSVDIDEWRSRLSIVRQDPHIFHETLRYNVAVGDPSASNESIEAACETACVTEFLPDLPNGYDTVLGDDGVRLSGGQRQRVALARALLKDADVLVLDEATSDIDTALESEIHRAIRTIGDDHIVIAVAHRLSTVRDADRLYILEEGSITDVGSHEELIEAGGTYAELFGAQTQAI